MEKSDKKSSENSNPNCDNVIKRHIEGLSKNIVIIGENNLVDLKKQAEYKDIIIENEATNLKVVSTDLIIPEKMAILSNQK